MMPWAAAKPSRTGTRTAYTRHNYAEAWRSVPVIAATTHAVGSNAAWAFASIAYINAVRLVFGVIECNGKTTDRPDRHIKRSFVDWLRFVV